jgi:MerR family transcriptional regulator, copper efflux regulator
MKTKDAIGTETIWKIGEIARKSGLGIETIRFYEKSGLISPVNRLNSGYRTYNQESVQRLQFIAKAKDLGFTLAQIKELLDLQWDHAASCAPVRGQIGEHLIAVRSKLRDLQRIADALEQLYEACDGVAPITSCPILNYLNRPEGGAHDNCVPD